MPGSCFHACNQKNLCDLIYKDEGGGRVVPQRKIKVLLLEREEAAAGQAKPSGPPATWNNPNSNVDKMRDTIPKSRAREGRANGTAGIHVCKWRPVRLYFTVAPTHMPSTSLKTDTGKE